MRESPKMVNDAGECTIKNTMRTNCVLSLEIRTILVLYGDCVFDEKNDAILAVV